MGPGEAVAAVPSGEFRSQRAYPGVFSGHATFGMLRHAHQTKGIRFFELDQKTSTYSVNKGFFRTPGLPVRVEAKLPSPCIVAAVVADCASTYCAKRTRNTVLIAGSF